MLSSGIKFILPPIMHRDAKGEKNAEGNHVFKTVSDFSVQVLTSQCVNCLRITAPQILTNYKSIIAAEYCSDVSLRCRSVVVMFISNGKCWPTQHTICTSLSLTDHFVGVIVWSPFGHRESQPVWMNNHPVIFY